MKKCSANKKQRTGEVQTLQNSMMVLGLDLTQLVMKFLFLNEAVRARGVAVSWQRAFDTLLPKNGSPYHQVQQCYQQFQLHLTRLSPVYHASVAPDAPLSRSFQNYFHPLMALRLLNLRIIKKVLTRVSISNFEPVALITADLLTALLNLVAQCDPRFLSRYHYQSLNSSHLGSIPKRSSFVKQLCLILDGLFKENRFAILKPFLSQWEHQLSSLPLATVRFQRHRSPAVVTQIERVFSQTRFHAQLRSNYIQFLLRNALYHRRTGEFSQLSVDFKWRLLWRYRREPHIANLVLDLLTDREIVTLFSNEQRDLNIPFSDVAFATKMRMLPLLFNSGAYFSFSFVLYALPLCVPSLRRCHSLLLSIVSMPVSAVHLPYWKMTFLIQSITKVYPFLLDLRCTSILKTTWQWCSQPPVGLCAAFSAPAVLGNCHLETFSLGTLCILLLFSIISNQKASFDEIKFALQSGFEVSQTESAMLQMQMLLSATVFSSRQMNKLRQPGWRRSLADLNLFSSINNRQRVSACQDANAPMVV